MKICAAIVMGFLLDLWLADPAWMPHPVVIMGKCITGLEKFLRARFPATPEGERAAGRVLAVVLPVGTLLLTAAVCVVANRLHPLLGLAVQTIWCWQALAVKGLAVESRRVYGCLAAEDLPGARKAVARIVGRDTQNLTEEGVTKAAIETVAENFSDGVIAPLVYMLIGGAPLALCYKAINTMDSMVGYKNQRYLHFGRAAARLDDAANFLPSRLAALFWILAAALTGQDGKKCLADLAAGPPEPCQPQQRPDRVGLCRGAGRAAGGTCLLFWRILRQAHNWGCPACGGAAGYPARQPDAVCRGLCSASCGAAASRKHSVFLEVNDAAGAWRRLGRI